MEIIYGQVLDQPAQSDQKLIRDMDVNDRPDDLAVIDPLILPFIIYMQKLIDNIGKFLGKFFADLGAGIFGGHHFADLHQPVNVDPLPLVRGLPLIFPNPQDFLRIIDQIGQFLLVLLRDHVAKCLFDLLPDDP